MTIYHDAYLFDPKGLASALSPYINALREGEQGYLALRSEVIRLLDDSPQVQELADRYGAWDKKGVLETSPEYYPVAQYDIRFLVMFLIYDKLSKPEAHKLGLAYNDDILKQALALIGWDESDANLLIRGKGFKYFAQQWLDVQDEVVNNKESFWNYVRPSSTLGHAGWINLSSMDGLLNRLIADEPRLPSLVESSSGLDIASVINAYEAAKRMLVSAKEAGCDLCVIISG